MPGFSFRQGKIPQKNTGDRNNKRGTFGHVVENNQPDKPRCGIVCSKKAIIKVISEQQRKTLY
jgi:hypothetical protein